eukprot:CAMPEP_0174925712 /NCGR_PEP_ID=MMETSP1355-20121228/8098_1 /TAXON_ID=464990 /ORGANISM="Hemiselmis tepida, Strain CCMP443" /LENGTH=180 /DNA_ID=CAMNT_0016171661 /DNA_START=185 /DNA_END=724 /DNA_ORIENTATION=-
MTIGDNLSQIVTNCPWTNNAANKSTAAGVCDALHRRGALAHGVEADWVAGGVPLPPRGACGGGAEGPESLASEGGVSVRAEVCAVLFTHVNYLCLDGARVNPPLVEHVLDAVNREGRLFDLVRLQDNVRRAEGRVLVKRPDVELVNVEDAGHRQQRLPDLVDARRALELGRLLHENHGRV